LGAHLSIAGGLHHAIRRAHELACSALQIFTHSTVQWRIKSLSTDEVALFKQTREALGPFALAAHAGYLVNLASPDRALRERSIRTMIRELERCEILGIPLLVFHPGAHMGAGEARGLKRIASALRRIHAATAGIRVATTLENTAGQGSALGWRLSQIADLLDASGDSARLKVCFDTAHGFAAGYDFRRREGYRALWDEFEGLIGLEKLAIFHLNDATREAGSRIDRHAHIGQGRIGRKPFGWLMTDERFAQVPKIIETPKRGGMDRRNLALLRRLAVQGRLIK
jgi:deoxyribonuclease-4